MLVQVYLDEVVAFDWCCLPFFGLGECLLLGFELGQAVVVFLFAWGGCGFAFGWRLFGLGLRALFFDFGDQLFGIVVVGAHGCEAGAVLARQVAEAVALLVGATHACLFGALAAVIPGGRCPVEVGANLKSILLTRLVTLFLNCGSSSHRSFGSNFNIVICSFSRRLFAIALIVRGRAILFSLFVAEFEFLLPSLR